MGQRVVGQLLVVGPERSVGTCGVHHLRHLFPPEKPALFSTSMAIPWLYDPRFAVVLMTYFGVNYLLGGMHSYANS